MIAQGYPLLVKTLDQDQGIYWWLVVGWYRSASSDRLGAAPDAPLVVPWLDGFDPAHAYGSGPTRLPSGHRVVGWQVAPPLDY